MDGVSRDDGAHDRLLLRLWDAESALAKTGPVGTGVSGGTGASGTASEQHLRAEIDALRIRIRNLERSTSWRLTKPLRTFGDVLKWIRRIARAVTRKGAVSFRTHRAVRRTSQGAPAVSESVGGLTALEQLIVRRVEDSAAGRNGR
jgi:hypothetical protein